MGKVCSAYILVIFCEFHQISTYSYNLWSVAAAPPHLCGARCVADASCSAKAVRTAKQRLIWALGPAEKTLRPMCQVAPGHCIVDWKWSKLKIPLVGTKLYATKVSLVCATATPAGSDWARSPPQQKPQACPFPQAYLDRLKPILRLQVLLYFTHFRTMISTAIQSQPDIFHGAFCWGSLRHLGPNRNMPAGWSQEPPGVILLLKNCNSLCRKGHETRESRLSSQSRHGRIGNGTHN